MVVITNGGTIGSGVIYGRGMPVDSGSSGGADGSGVSQRLRPKT